MLGARVALRLDVWWVAPGLTQIVVRLSA